jgi:hypothetical protein
MKTDEALMKQVAVDVLANPRANRTAARLAQAYLELLAERERARRDVVDLSSSKRAIAEDVAANLHGRGPRHEKGDADASTASGR